MSAKSWFGNVYDIALFINRLLLVSFLGNYIDEIHNKWWGNYELLEYHHSYIQWYMTISYYNIMWLYYCRLFPIRERGLNWYAKELQPHEIDVSIH